MTLNPVRLRALVPVQVAQAEASSEPANAPCLDFICSTGDLDRYGEIIEPTGWRLDDYRRNPVFQNAHRYGDVSHTIGRALITEVRDIGNGRKGLFQRIQFAVDVNPVAKIAYGLYRDGFLRAVSVGFIPLRWEEGNERSGFRRRYIEQELLEVSAVAVPANREALVLNTLPLGSTPSHIAAARQLRDLLLVGTARRAVLR
ncbi:hypothetical protein EG829_26145 [bacterium]|nr:hypothetical protein [bacterium]